jgi:hypothetical protein
VVALREILDSGRLAYPLPGRHGSHLFDFDFGFGQSISSIGSHLHMLRYCVALSYDRSVKNSENPQRRNSIRGLRFHDELIERMKKSEKEE